MTRPWPIPGNQVFPEKICDNLRWLIGFAGLVLIGQTWRLWFGTPVFPQVPLVSWFIDWPIWCDWAAGGLMVLSLFFLLDSRPRANQIATFVFAVAFLFAVLLNQHRLQPWGYEFCVLLLVIALLPASQAVFCLRLIVASIYLHSGLSKLDVTFLTTHGEALLSVLTNAVGWDLMSAPVGVRRAVVAMLPAGEILVAVGLLVPKTRRLAKWTSVVMHLMLLWILGPWGLGHKPGVLIWNVYFIAQNLFLFHPLWNPADWEKEGIDEENRKRYEGAKLLAKARAAEEEVIVAKRQASRFHRILHRGSLASGYTLTLAVVLLPFLEPLGLYDHWPAWAVYASRPERARVFVAENRVPDLPVEIQAHITDEKPADAIERFFAGKPPLKRLLIDRWSLDALDAPIYPQNRFHIGVALALANQYVLGEDLRVEIDGPADRWTGKRTMTILEGTAAIEDAAREYRLNALPR